MCSLFLADRQFYDRVVSLRCRRPHLKLDQNDIMIYTRKEEKLEIALDRNIMVFAVTQQEPGAMHSKYESSVNTKLAGTRKARDHVDEWKFKLRARQ